MKPPVIDETLLKTKIQELGMKLRASAPEGMGFALLLFEFGNTGAMTYVSNADSKTFIDALKELIRVLETRGN